MEQALSRLPRGEEVAGQLAAFASRVADFAPGGEDVRRLHEAIDDFQIDLAGLHAVITRTWLDPSRHL